MTFSTLIELSLIADQRSAPDICPDVYLVVMNRLIYPNTYRMCYIGSII